MQATSRDPERLPPAHRGARDQAVIFGLAGAAVSNQV
jgi:hypothetical protein